MSSGILADAYDRDVYNALSHFQEAKGDLEEKGDKIPVLGDVICEYGLHEELGVSLLHKHFPLYHGEQIAKRYDRQKNVAHLYPTSTDRRRQAYMYKVRGAQDEFVYEPLEFFSRSKATDTVPSLAEVVDGEEEFLEAFAETAEELGVADTFGLTVLHLYIQRFDRGAQMPLETTDEENRVLTVTIEPREELDPAETTETLWVFAPPEEVAAGSVGRFGETSPAGECAHTCTHSCTHTCTHTCVHTCNHDEDLPIENFPEEIIERGNIGEQVSRSGRLR